MSALPYMQGGGELERAWNTLVEHVRAAQITAAAPLEVVRTPAGTHIVLRQRAAAGLVRVVAASTTEPEALFDATSYTVETTDEAFVVGADPSAGVYRVIPHMVRFGEGWRINPARPGTYGVVHDTGDKRIVMLWDERVAGVPCGGG